jgi:hypothetical protein
MGAVFELAVTYIVRLAIPISVLLATTNPSESQPGVSWYQSHLA